MGEGKGIPLKTMCAGVYITPEQWLILLRLFYCLA